MKYLFICIVFLLSIQCFSQAQKSLIDYGLCNTVSISNSIWNFEKQNLILSEYWNLYDRNDTLTLLPEKIYVKSIIDCFLYTTRGETPLDDLVLTISIQLKLSNNTNCIVPVNPVLTKDITIGEKKIKYSDFFIGQKQVPEDYRNIECTFEFDLKKIYLDNVGDENNPLFLNQIIIKSKLVNLKSKKYCSSEYIHFICTMYSPHPF